MAKRALRGAMLVKQIRHSKVSFSARAPLAFLAAATAGRCTHALSFRLLTSACAACADALSTLTLTVLDLVHGMTPV
jgi:hypothetical protein